MSQATHTLSRRSAIVGLAALPAAAAGSAIAAPGDRAIAALTSELVALDAQLEAIWADFSADRIDAAECETRSDPLMARRYAVIEEIEAAPVTSPDAIRAKALAFRSAAEGGMIELGDEGRVGRLLDQILNHAAA